MTLAFIFPGQGSQSVGMLSGLAGAHPVVEATYGEASQRLGIDLWRLASEGPAEALDRTEVTQPAMLCAGVAAWRVWQEAGGPAPAMVAGHSLGEYTALVCAGALELAEALDLVAQRARAMQAAVPAGAGAMAALLGLEDATVEAVCREAAGGEVVEPANYNAPGQVVVAGHRAAVERAVALARQRGARRAVTLPVSVPSHCSLMRPAAQALAPALDAVALRRPVSPVLHNVSAAEAPDPEAMRAALREQLYSPVRWAETVRAMRAAGVDTVIECGPGRVLTGLVRRIERDLTVLPLLDEETLAAALERAR